MRTKSMRLWLALAASITLLAGCGGDPSQDPSSYEDTDAGSGTAGETTPTPPPDPACQGIIGGEPCLPQPVADAGDIDAGESVSTDTGSATVDTGTPAVCPPEDLPDGTRMICGNIRCSLYWDLTDCTATCGPPPNGYPRPYFWGAPVSAVRTFPGCKPANTY